MKTHPLQHSATALMALAQERTGIHDIADTAIVERLERLVDSLNREAELNEHGVAGMERHLLRVLCNRLWMLRDFRDHPEIAEQRIERPIIMSGGPRTGSTKLHKMLAASGDFHWLPYWQGYSLALRSGDRDEDPAPRIDDADAHVRWFNERSPEAKLTHEFSTYEPEEENMILEHCLFPPYVPPFVMVPSYVQWAMPQGLLWDLEFLKQGLQYLQWQFHDGKLQDGKPRRWLLKNPGYVGMEGLLAQVFPDAVFVTTNRDPVDTMSSGASLVASYHRIYSDADRRKLVALPILEGFSMATQMHIALREQHPELPILDIGYREEIQDMTNVIRKVYAHAGMPLSGLALQRMQQWEQGNSQHKLGAHRHTLADAGLTPEMVSQKFAPYIERFGHLF